MTTTSTSTGRKNLRDVLLEGLGSVPGTREFHVHVLQTWPRRTTSLYRYAQPRPKTYVQDVLVLLSEGSGGEGGRVLVAGIEAYLYHIPVTSSAILYVCKVDSTGQNKGKSATKQVVEAFLKYYTDPKTRPVGEVKRLWIQLFARAQGQYLFPESSEWEGKRPLGDVQLCGWWKEVLGTVGVAGASVKAYYLLPGYSQLEAEQMLLSQTLPEIAWEYGHPYHVLELPCPRDRLDLGHIIPYFEDDPKSRFLDEMAHSTGQELRRPARKRARTETSVKETGHVTVDDFWERMSFRQECVAGAVTGFFTVVVVVAGQGATVDQVTEGHVSLAMHRRVRTALTTGVSFATTARAMQATEMIERLCREEVGCLSGTVAVQNGDRSVRGSAGVRGSDGVTVLAARRKKK